MHRDNDTKKNKKRKSKMKKKTTPKTPQFVYNVLRIQVLSQTDA